MLNDECARESLRGMGMSRVPRQQEAAAPARLDFIMRAARVMARKYGEIG